MCTIVGSFDPVKLEELIELNSYRGNHSYSLLKFNWRKNSIMSLSKGFGEFPYSLLNNEVKDDETYWLAHVQAPTTTGNGFFDIHPSEYENSLLWHNGILKEDYIKELQEDFGYGIKWDTKLLHFLLHTGEDLSGVDGTFSCVYWDGNDLLVFRNEISPLFSDSDWNISSTKFEGSRSTLSGKVIKLDFKEKLTHYIEEFTTRENPYFFG